VRAALKQPDADAVGREVPVGTEQEEAGMKPGAELGALWHRRSVGAWALCPRV
jgi:hypothetical protein